MVLERLVELDGAPPTPPELYLLYQLLEPGAWLACLKQAGATVLALEAP